MSEHDINLVTGQAGGVVAENQKVTLGQASASLTPATLTAMIGIKNATALTLAAPVQDTLATLANIAASNSSANVAAAAAITSMNSFHSSMGFGGTPNHAAFGSFINQFQGHIQDSQELRKATDFMANTSYSDFGAGVKDLGSTADRGMTNVFGSLPSAGAAMTATGSMFNGIDVKNFGSPVGIVKSLQANKLANATGVNDKLAAAGVPLDDLDNPIYADKISQVMGSIKDPTAINVAADQYGITNPFGGLPSYNGNDSSLYSTPTFLGGTSTPSDLTGAVTMGTSTASTTFGAGQAPEVGVGGIQSLKDLGDPTKLNPSGTAGLTGGIGGLTTQLNDMGAGSVVNASAAGSLFGQIQSIQTPLHTAAYPTLNSLVTSNQGTLDTLTGAGTGPKGLPSMTDFTQHLAGGPSITSFLQNVGTDASAAISALTSSIAGAISLVATAGVDLTSPPPNTLGSAMGFAKNLHKFGADTSGSGVGDILRNMANTTTAEGEAIKASLTEGKNNKLLAKNGIPPIVTTPPPPVGQETTVEYPITVTRRFDRPPSSTIGSYITVEATATGPSDQIWTITNGETTTKAGKPPFSELYRGNYATLYAAAKEQSTDFTTTGPDVYAQLPGMKAEFDSLTSGKTPKALG